jgi:hypothetical protein
MREYTVERLGLEIRGHGATGGPKMEIAIRRLSDEVIASGDTMIRGSLVVKRNRHRGQWRPGWMATCEAIKDGQAHGYGYEYSLVKRWDEYAKAVQYKFAWSYPPKKDS